MHRPKYSVHTFRSELSIKGELLVRAISTFGQRGSTNARVASVTSTINEISAVPLKVE
jgi:hypothetical protein